MVILAMVLIIDGSAEIGAHVRSNIFNLICLRHLIRSRAIINCIFLLEDLFSFKRAQHILSYDLKYLNPFPGASIPELRQL